MISPATSSTVISPISIVPLSFAAILLGVRELRLLAGSAAELGERKSRRLRKRAPSDCNRTY
jgi:hypothetical protein